MRLVAAVLLTCAAFAVGVPFLDRAGVAILGAAFAALALPRAPLSPWRRSRRAEYVEAIPSAAFDIRGAHGEEDELADMIADGGLGDVAQRIREYTGAR